MTILNTNGSRTAIMNPPRMIPAPTGTLPTATNIVNGGVVPAPGGAGVMAATATPTVAKLPPTAPLTSSGTPFQSLAETKATTPATQAFYDALPKYYSGSTVAGQTADQIAAAEMVRNTATSQNALLGNYLTNFVNTPASAPAVTAAGPSTSVGGGGSVSTAAATVAGPQYTEEIATDPRLQKALDFALGGILEQGGNPYAKASMDAATRQITDNFTQQVLPQLGSAAQRAGAWGGSRQGIVEGLAAGETAQAVGDTAAKISADNYATSLGTFNAGMGVAESLRGQDVQQRQIKSAEHLAKYKGDLELAVANRQISSQEAQAMLNAETQRTIAQAQITSSESIANREISSREAQANAQRSLEELLGKTSLLPSLLDAGYKPAQMLDAVGQNNQNYDQALINADVNRHNFEQNKDAERLALYASLLSGQSTSGIGSGGGSTTTSKAPSTSNLQNALGGASAGAAIGSMTNFENGGTWGALLGALAGLAG